MKNIKRILLLSLMLVLSLAIVACSPGTDPKNGGNGIVDDNGDNGDEQEYSLEDYYPIEENRAYIYGGEGNEFASKDVYTDYISEDGNTVQYREVNDGTTLAIIVERREDEIVKTYSRGEAYYRENYIANPTLKRQDEVLEEVLIKEPLEVGNSWTVEYGRTRSITGLDVDVETPYGDYSALEVTTQGVDYESRDYYAPGIGHIKSEFTNEENFQVTTFLEDLQTDTPFVDNINFYYPNLDEDTYYYDSREVEFYTNDITRSVIADAYKEGSNDPSPSLGTVFTPNTNINYLFADKNGHAYVDLNSEFISEMNAGAYYETMILNSIGLTIGDYYNQASRVYLRIDNNRYESGHIIIEKDEYLDVDYSNRVKM